MKRRKIRKYKAGKQNSWMKFIWIIGIIIVAVICGYMSARFIIGPMLGYDTEVLKFDFPSKITAAIESKTDDGNEKDQKKYALQYGLFSEKNRAQKLVTVLKTSDVTAEIIEVDGKYKVISDKCQSKDEAVEKLKNAPTDKVENVFITDI